MTTTTHHEQESRMTANHPTPTILPASGPDREALIRRMRDAHLWVDRTDSRRGMEAAYDALRHALQPAAAVGQMRDSG